MAIAVVAVVAVAVVAAAAAAAIDVEDDDGEDVDATSCLSVDGTSFVDDDPCVIATVEVVDEVAVTPAILSI